MDDLIWMMTRKVVKVATKATVARQDPKDHPTTNKIILNKKNRPGKKHRIILRSGVFCLYLL